MAENTTLDILIRSALDSSGFDQFQAKLKESKTGTDQATASAKEFSTSITELGAKFLAAAGLTLGLAEAFHFLKESFSAAVEESRALDQMRAVNESIAHATTDARIANEQWLQSLENASGKTKEELVPSYVRLVGVTQNVSEAQRILQIATGASVKGFGELGQITQALIRYYETGETQTRGFGAVIKSLVGDARDAGEGFDRLNQYFKDAGATTDNLGVKVDRLKAHWHDFKAEIGGFVSDFVQFIADIHAAGAAVGDFADINSPAAVAALEKLKATSKSLADGLNEDCAKIVGGVKTVEQQLKILTEQYDLAAVLANNASASVVAGKRAELAIYKQMAADPDYQAATSDLQKAQLAQKIKALEAGITADVQTAARQRAQAVRQQYDEEIQLATVNAVSRYALLNEEIAIYKRMASDPAVNRKDQIDALEKLRQKEDALAKEEQHNLETLVLKGRTVAQFFKDMEEQRVADVTKATNERIKLDLKEAKALRDMSAQELADHRAALVADQALDEQYTENAIALKQKIAAIDRQVNENFVRNFQAAAAATIEIGTAIFGHSKGMAIAQSIINAAAGIVAIFGDPANEGTPYWLKVVEAAALAATAGAQIATIESTTPSTTSGASSGFDDPANDLDAVVGGRKWARDYINLTGAGFADELRHGDWAARASSVVNNSMTNRGGDRHYHITINGGVLGSDDVAARQLWKRLLPYVQNLDPQRLAR